MAPPQLSTDTPILNIVEEEIPHVLVGARFNGQLTAADMIDRSLGHYSTVHEPLRHQQRLDHITRTRAQRQRGWMIQLKTKKKGSAS
jgi:hypothetical protein